MLKAIIGWFFYRPLDLVDGIIALNVFAFVINFQGTVFNALILSFMYLMARRLDVHELMIHWHGEDDD